MVNIIEMREERRENKKLRKVLTALFNEKGLIATIEKRAAVKEVFGSERSLASMNTEELNQLIKFVEGKQPEELKSKFVVWAQLMPTSGVKKTQMMGIFDVIPGQRDLMPFTINNDVFDQKSSFTIGYVDNEYYDQLDMIKEVLSKVDIAKDNREEKVYELPNGMRALIC